MQLEAIVRRIVALMRNPEAKVLVFSSWKDVLELIAHALRTNDLHYAFAHGRRGLKQAIAQLKAEPAEVAAEQPAKRSRRGRHSSVADLPARVLLLLTKQGSNGLNLTGACS